MHKIGLRKLYKEKRAALSALQVNKMDDLLLINFQSLPLQIPHLLMSYLAFESEFDPYPVTDYCRFKVPGLRLAYPVIDADRNNIQAVLTHEESIFEENFYHIHEPVKGEVASPADIGMIIVPLLAYDLKGFRVGYGKGYYDRFLARCASSTIKIGFSYFAPEESIDDAGSWDMPIDYCITPEKVYDFTSLK